ncbi:MAG TPA: helix-turn-helix transcriptional regulator [Pyrinomonadaceae bacterium]|nr:helix-turn-helix transcriptional regulator [Pyrinomonadaceae bacterium]
MFPQKSQISPKVDPKTYPLGEQNERATNDPAKALVALSHSPVERRLYASMLLASNGDSNDGQLFTVRSLIELTGIQSLSTIRRGLEGLVSKFSVEREGRTHADGPRDQGVAYRVFPPEEVIARRNENGFVTYGKGIATSGRSFERVIQRVAENRNLSRREAQVALCCVEGLTNAGIGLRLMVTEQTVKFHLRHIFIKFGVKRRAELISRLLL